MTDESVEIEATLLDDRILVEPEPAPKTTAAGLALPERHADDIGESVFRVGRVVAAGPGQRCEQGVNLRHSMDVAPGDRVVYHKNRGDKIYLNGGSFLVMGNRDICMVIGENTDVARIVIR